jgi:8-oxo-dGTP diphosphatase
MSEPQAVQDYPKKTFEHVIVAVDVAILSIFDNKLQVLLLKPKDEILEGKWALPGGLVKIDETLDVAVSRHLQTKAGISNVYLEQLYTFGALDRDPLGRVVSVSYIALCRKDAVHPTTSDRYSEIKWFPMDDLPPLAYDHSQILVAARDRLKAKLSYTNIVYSLLPEHFSLTDLQNHYEYVLGHKLDKRNFRKKILSLSLLQKTDKMTSGTANRPAALYSFSHKEPQVVEML